MNRESVWNIEPVTHDEKPNNPTGCGSCRSVSWSAGRRPSRTRSLAVSVTATSSPSGPVHAATPVLPPCGPAGRKDSDFRPAALHIVSACSAPAGADCRNGTGESEQHVKVSSGYGQPAGAQCPGKIRFKPFDTGSGLV